MFSRIPYLSYITNFGRSITTTLSIKNHYDALGITPKATHADVKSAYYKLSKIYHPDRNQGSVDAANKFRDITAAYEVLGNIRLRKLYDKGVDHVGIKIQQPKEDDDPATKFYRSREHRSRPPTTGRTPIYDFDEWSRAHYGATFARDMARKRREQLIRAREEMDKNDIKVEKVCFLFLMLLAAFLFMTNEPNHDNITYIRNNNSNTSGSAKPQ